MLIQWANQSISLGYASILIQLDQPSSVELVPTGTGIGAFRPMFGETVQWQLPTGERCEDLQVTGNTLGTWRFEPVATPVDEPQAPILMVFQRGDNEDGADFLSRVMQPYGQRWARPDGSDAPLSPPPVDQAWPVGATCLLSSHSTAVDAASGLLHVARANVPALRGACPGLQLAADVPAPWRLRFHLPTSDDENHNCDIGTGWSLGANSEDGGQVYVTRSGVNLEAGDLSDLLKSLLNPSNTLVRVADLVFPRMPTTVHFGEGQSGYFCTATRVDIALNNMDGSRSWTCTVSLRLAKRVCTHESYRPVSQLLLAQCAQTPSKGGDRLYRIAPPDGNDCPVEPALRPAVHWNVSPEGSQIVSARLSPGFVRPKEAAFYSKLKRGDLVWVRLAHGEVPLILGALHQRLDRWEGGEQECDVAIGAHTIDIGGDSDRARIRLEGGKALLSAPDALVVRSKSTDVTGKLSVEGEFNASDVARFKSDVTVG